ncbi:MAG: NlpC/P60 family protein [Peptoniphilaceae bacterium]|nr:NlpC/P60 family protein [Peptoniphilaceae bacterium]MDY6085186.1 NlpC/P60 family protein [Peptoniphilaceae bacterium]
MDKKRLGAVVGVVGAAGVLAATQFLDIESSQAEHISKDLTARFNATVQEARNKQAQSKADIETTEDETKQQAAQMAESLPEQKVHYDVAQKVEYVIGGALEFAAEPVVEGQRLPEKDAPVQDPSQMDRFVSPVEEPEDDENPAPTQAETSQNPIIEIKQQAVAQKNQETEAPDTEEALGSSNLTFETDVVVEEDPAAETADEEPDATEEPEEAEPARDFIGKVRPEALNVRSDASTEASVLSVLVQDEVVRGTLKDGWVSFDDAEGLSGFVKSEFLIELNEAEAEEQEEVNRVRREKEAEEKAKAEAEAARKAAEEKAKAEKEAAERAEAEAKAKAEAEKKAAAEAAQKKAEEEAAAKKKAEEEAAQRSGDPISGYLQYVSNVRKGPGLDFDTVTTLKINTYIEGEEIDGWVKFNLDGETVFVSGALLDDEKVGQEEQKPDEVDEEDDQDEEEGEPRSSGGLSSVLDYAESKLGDAYVWGAAGPNSFDCSGLVVAAYRQAGISLPHSSASQFNRGYAVSLDNLECGDLLFFDTNGSGGVSHVGIYVGGGQMIHASTPSTGVRYDSINSPYYSSRFLGARRIFN